MRITYRKSNGEVVMVGQGVDNDTLASATVVKDAKQLQGYKMRYTGGKINYEKPDWMENEEKQEQIKKDFQADIASIDKAKDLTEIKSIITKLATKIYNQ
jgi:Mor family transcriptional regulator